MLLKSAGLVEAAAGLAVCFLCVAISLLGFRVIYSQESGASQEEDDHV